MPINMNAPGIVQALVDAFRLRGEYRVQLDETVSPVAIVARLDGGAAADWPKNLSADWRRGALTMNVNTNPATWWRFSAPAGSNTAARLLRIVLNPYTSTPPMFAIFRGDASVSLGGVPGALLRGGWMDETGTVANAFAGSSQTAYGLTPMTATLAPLNFTENPLAIISSPGAQDTNVLELGIDCRPGEFLSVVPLMKSAPGAIQLWRFEAVVATVPLTLEWAEEW